MDARRPQRRRPRDGNAHIPLTDRPPVRDHWNKALGRSQMPLAKTPGKRKSFAIAHFARKHRHAENKYALSAGMPTQALGHRRAKGSSVSPESLGVWQSDGTRRDDFTRHD